MIIISQYGGFHARHGAEAAHAIGKLQTFLTDSPKYAQLPSDKIHDLKWQLNLPPRIIGKLGRVLHWPGLQRQQAVLHEWGKRRFMRIAEKSITKKTTIFHAYSAFQESCWDRCEKLGVKKVIDWGIAHPAYLSNLLNEEYKYWKLPVPELPQTERIVEELSRADTIVIPSTFVENTFLKHGFPKELLFRNPYGVSLQHFEPRKRPRPSGGALRIAMTGALSVRKGALYLLEAVRELKKRGVPCKLYLFAGWEKGLHEKAKPYQDVISHQGGVPHHELADWYANIDVFVLPSLTEGMARVVIEAMACGLPCIITPHCGYEGIIRDGENGFEVPIRDSNAIADRLQLLYEQPEQRRQLGAKALITAHNQTWDHYKQGLQHIYQKLV